MINELDCVRLTQNFTGEDAFGGGVVTLPAGEEGCAILAGSDACEVEFTHVDYGPGDDVRSWSTTIMVVPNSHLVKTWDMGTGMRV